MHFLANPPLFIILVSSFIYFQEGYFADEPSDVNHENVIDESSDDERENEETSCISRLMEFFKGIVMPYLPFAEDRRIENVEPSDGDHESENDMTSDYVPETKKRKMNYTEK